MKCMFCAGNNIEESDIKVEGKLYGLTVKKKGDKKKHNVKAICCKDCGMIFLQAYEEKQKEYQYIIRVLLHYSNNYIEFVV